MGGGGFHIFIVVVICVPLGPKAPFSQDAEHPTKGTMQLEGQTVVVWKFHTAHEQYQRPNPHRTRDATRNARQANGTY